MVTERDRLQCYQQLIETHPTIPPPKASPQLTPHERLLKYQQLTVAYLMYRELDTHGDL